MGKEKDPGSTRNYDRDDKRTVVTSIKEEDLGLHQQAAQEVEGFQIIRTSYVTSEGHSVTPGNVVIEVVKTARDGKRDFSPFWSKARELKQQGPK